MSKNKNIKISDIDQNKFREKLVDLNFLDEERAYISNIDFLGIGEEPETMKIGVEVTHYTSSDQHTHYKIGNLKTKYYDMQTKEGLTEFFLTYQGREFIKSIGDGIPIIGHKAKYFIDFEEIEDTIIFEYYSVKGYIDIFDKFNYKDLECNLLEILVIKEDDCYIHNSSNKNITRSLLSGNNKFSSWGNCYMLERDYGRLLNNDKLKRSGIVDLVKLAVNSKDGKILPPFYLSEYIYYYKRYPYIEQLIKYPNTKDCIFKSPRYIQYFNKGTTVTEITGISKYMFKLMEKEKFDNFLGVRTVLDYFKKGEITSNKDWEDLLFLCIKIRGSNNLMEYLMKVIYEFNFSIKISDIRKYIEKVNLYQAIDFKSALMIWKDYLKFVGDLELDSYDLYPSSLKLNHDLMSRNYQYNLDSIKEDKFEKERIKNEKYQMETKNYCIINPKDIKSVINEGKNLHHCVASYINDIISGYTHILFLRSKEDKDKSLYTIEIKDGKIIQVKGASNRLVSDKEVEVNELLNKLKNKLNKEREVI